MKHMFRFLVPFACAVICMLSLSGCAFAKMANVAIETNQRLKQEELLKKLNIPPDVLSQIDPKYQVVAATNHLGSVFVASRLKASPYNTTRFIHYDSRITYQILPLHENAKEVEVVVKKGESEERFRMDNRLYHWIPYERKREVAGTPEK